MFVDFFVNYLSPITFFQSLLFSVYLFGHKKGNKKQNKLLALFLLSMGVMIGSRQFFYYPESNNLMKIFAAGFDFRFFIGPLFYLYLKSIFKPEIKLKPTDLFHTSIYFFVLIYQYMNETFWFNPWWFFVLIDMIQITVYLTWSVIEFKLIYLFTKPNYFKIEKRFVFWLQFFVVANIVTLALMIFTWLFIKKVIFITNWNYWIGRSIVFANFVFINTIVYAALKMPDLFFLIRNKNGELTEETLQKYRDNILNYMETKRPYLNPTLSLNSFAEELSIPPKHLSHVINNSFNQNFYHYINSYRINECIKKLGDKTRKNGNILDIAFESGFNSKNTFNSAFKKVTGMTPTQFKKTMV